MIKKLILILNWFDFKIWKITNIYIWISFIDSIKLKKILNKKMVFFFFNFIFWYVLCSKIKMVWEKTREKIFFLKDETIPLRKGLRKSGNFINHTNSICGLFELHSCMKVERFVVKKIFLKIKALQLSKAEYLRQEWEKKIEVSADYLDSLLMTPQNFIGWAKK